MYNTPKSQTDRQTGQRSDSIGRTVVQTVSQKSILRNRNMSQAQETAKLRAKFDWPPVSDVAAVTKARRETRTDLSR